jgi:hypothetical protein
VSAEPIAAKLRYDTRSPNENDGAAVTEPARINPPRH